FAAEDHGNMPLYRVSLDGSSAPLRMTEGDRNVTGYDIRDGVLVFSANDPLSLSELYSGDGRKLTDVGASFVGSRDLSAPERFVATSADGMEVECWAMRPVGLEAGAKAPTLLNIHGGPFTQYGNKFFDEFH